MSNTSENSAYVLSATESFGYVPSPTQSSGYYVGEYSHFVVTSPENNKRRKLDLVSNVDHNMSEPPTISGCDNSELRDISNLKDFHLNTDPFLNFNESPSFENELSCDILKDSPIVPCNSVAENLNCSIDNCDDVQLSNYTARCPLGISSVQTADYGESFAQLLDELPDLEKYVQENQISITTNDVTQHCKFYEYRNHWNTPNVVQLIFQPKIKDFLVSDISCSATCSLRLFCDADIIRLLSSETYHKKIQILCNDHLLVTLTCKELMKLSSPNADCLNN